MTGISAANNLPKEKIKINIGTNTLSIVRISLNNQNLSSKLLSLMPLLILHCRTETFPGHRSTADYTEWFLDFNFFSYQRRNGQ
jgi:hypothetical protein